MGTVSVIVVLAGVAFGAIGLLGMRGGLRRNRFVGVRTPAALRSDEAFLLANRAAGLPILVGGVAGVLGGGSALATGYSVVPLLVGLAGMLSIGLAGAAVGTRAAEALPAPAPGAPAGCGGCACGGCGR